MSKQILVFVATNKDGYSDAIFAADNFVTFSKMLDEWKQTQDMAYWRELRAIIVEYREESGIE